MLMRILTMRVAHEHLEDWKRYTMRRSVFPACSASLVVRRSAACAARGQKPASTKWLPGGTAPRI